LAGSSAVKEFILGSELTVLRASLFDGLPLDPFALFDGGGPAEVGIRSMTPVRLMPLAVQ